VSTVRSDGAKTLVWLVNNFVSEVPGALHAAVVSADGLLLVSSDGMPAAHAEQLAALASGLQSLAMGGSRLFGQGRIEQTMVKMERGYLFALTISDGSCLTVLASKECDLKVIGYQMAVFVESAGHVLTPELRRELRGSTPWGD
jgi:predicted regulator of Ras-like GTPase activity (Roadblock/LC7/MglB family)